MLYITSIVHIELSYIIHYINCIYRALLYYTFNITWGAFAASARSLLQDDMRTAVRGSKT